MADKIKDTEKIKRKIWEKYSQAMKRIPSKELEIYHNSSTPTDERQKIHDRYLAETSISLIDDIVATLDEESSLAYKNGDAEKKAFIVSSQLASILESQNRENLFLVTLTGYNEKSIEKIFTAQKAKLKFLKDFDTNAVNTDLASLFEIQQKLQNNDDFIKLNSKLSQGEKLFCIVRGPTDKTITIGNKYSNNNKSTDFSNFIIVGDYNSGKQDVQDAIKLLPYAVIGKLIISSWNKELFSKINVLPYAEIIDCSHSINSLNDLNGKLPNGLKTLIVQDALIKPTSLSKDETKRSIANDFLVAHPDLRIISTNKNGDTVFDLQESLKEVTKQKGQLGQKKNTTTVSVTPKIVTTEIPAEYISINAFVDKYLINNPKINISDKQILRNIVKQVANIKTIPGIETKYVVESENTVIIAAVIAHIAQKQNELDDRQAPTNTSSIKRPKEQNAERNDLSNNRYRIQNKILKFIANSDLEVLSNNADKEELKKSIDKFNIWNQKNINNRSCTFIDTDGTEKPLPNMICRNNNTYSYDGTGGKARVDFKSTTLKDINGNNVLDENGNEIYVLVSVGAVSDHKRGNSDKRTKKHNDIIRNLDIYVTDAPLSDTQIKTIKNNKKAGRDIRFFTLPELQGLTQKYISYTYEPTDKNETKQPEKPQQSFVAEPSIIDKDTVKEDSSNAFQVVDFAQPKAKYIKPNAHAAPKNAPHVDTTAPKEPESHDVNTAPITKRPYIQPVSNVGGVFGLKMLEAQITTQIELLKTLKENQENQKREIEKISKQMQEKIKDGDFASVGKLATQAETKKQKLHISQEKLEQAEQELKTMKSRFETGQKLIAKRNTALSEKQAAEKALQEKEQSLKEADDAIKKFLDGIVLHDE